MSKECLKLCCLVHANWVPRSLWIREYVFSNCQLRSISAILSESACRSSCLISQFCGAVTTTSKQPGMSRPGSTGPGRMPVSGVRPPSGMAGRASGRTAREAASVRHPGSPKPPSKPCLIWSKLCRCSVPSNLAVPQSTFVLYLSHCTEKLTDKPREVRSRTME